MTTVVAPAGRLVCPHGCGVTSPEQPTAIEVTHSCSKKQFKHIVMIDASGRQAKPQAQRYGRS